MYKIRLIAYKNYSKDIEIEKSLVEVGQFDGMPVVPFDVSNPIVRFTIESENDINLVVPQFNYIQLFELSRFYYVNKINYLGNNLFELECKLDVLYTYKNLIVGQDGIINRNQFVYNDFLNDSKLPSTFKNIVESFPSANFSVGDAGELPINAGYGVYYIVVANNKDLQSAISINGMVNIGCGMELYQFDSYRDFSKFIDSIYNPSFIESVGRFFSNPAEYIVKIFCSPINLHLLSLNIGSGVSSTSVTKIPIGKTEIPYDPQEGAVNTVTAYRIDATSKLKLYLTFPKIYMKGFCDYNPISEYSIYLPFIGTQNIDDFVIEKEYRFAVYHIDILTGDFIVLLTRSPSFHSEDRILYSWNGNIYTEIPLGSTNGNEIMLNTLINALSFGVSATKVIKGQKSILEEVPGTRKFDASVDKLNSHINTIFSASINSISDYIPRADFSKPTENNLMWKLPFTGKIIKISKNYFYPEKYEEIIGKPIDEYFSFGSIAGYTVIGDFQYRNSTGNTLLTLSEVEEIKKLLSQGVIFPYGNCLVPKRKYMFKDYFYTTDQCLIEWSFESNDEYFDNIIIVGNKVYYGDMLVCNDGVWISDGFKILEPDDDYSVDCRYYSVFTKCVNQIN